MHSHYTNRNILYRQFIRENKRPPYIQYGRGYHTLTPFIGSRNQKGYGIGGILKGIFKTVIPLIKPVVKSAGKALGRRALKGGIKVAENVMKGQNIKQALKREAEESLSDLGSQVVSHFSKERKLTPRKTISRKRNKKGRRISRASNVRDIFE